MSMRTHEFWNGCRFDPQTKAGHYTSYFERANHPTRPKAFWIRYTIYCPTGHPEQAEGELFAIWFDGEALEVTAVQKALPFKDCAFAQDKLGVRIGAAELWADRLVGEIEEQGKSIAWDLRYRSDAAPALLYPEPYYGQKLPRAKIVVPRPIAHYDGVLRFASGKEERIDGWMGSQNYTWGTRHTDLYAWGQVVGFDGAPDAFLDCGSGRLKFGPFWTPWLSPMLLRLDGEETKMSTPGFLWKARCSVREWRWQIEAHGDGVDLSAVFSAPKESFATLAYRNPPGGVKRCLNTKIARCELTVKKRGQPARTLVSPHGAAFEILGDGPRLDRLGFLV
jgi:hypothetical protein